MRWVILTDDCAPMAGGVATWTERVREELERRGMRVKVYARHQEGLETARGVRGPSFATWGGLWLAIAAARDLWRADVILATTWPVATWVSRSPSLAERLQVVLHGSDVTRPARSESARLRVLRAADQVWAVSAYLVRCVQPWGVVATVLPAPVNPGSSRPELSSLRRAVCVCRAVPRKGGERFIRLVAAAGLEGVMIGGGPETERWKRVAKEVGARVTFAGPVRRQDMALAYRDVDVAVLLPHEAQDGSGAEGLGLVLLEAASHGVPVVGCDVGGVKEAVGPHGCLLQDPDDAEASAAQVLDWWTSEKGKQARSWVAQTHGTARLVDWMMEAVGP